MPLSCFRYKGACSLACLTHFSRMLKHLRKDFVSGIFVLAPLAVTLWVIRHLIEWLGGPTRDFFFFFVSENLKSKEWFVGILTVVSACIVLLCITLIGALSRLVFGKLLVGSVERLMNRVPLVKTIYGTVKQIIDTIAQQKKAVFQRAVMIEFPRSGLYSIGFLTSEANGEVQFKTDSEVWNVFVPTTPNPTSGWLIMVPKEDVILLDMTIGDAMKLIISGGAVVPVFDPATHTYKATPQPFLKNDAVG